MDKDNKDARRSNTKPPLKIVHKGEVHSYVNSLCEDIYFSDSNPQKLGNIIFPVMAGLTKPDPRYFCRRSPTDKNNPYLYVLEYVTAGRGTIEINGKKHRVRAGDFYMINRCTVPYYYSDTNDPLEKKWLNVAGRFMNSICYTYAINEPLMIVHMDAERYFDRIHEMLSNYDFQNHEQTDLELMQLLIELFDEIHRSKKSPTDKPERAVFEQILEYIVSNITFERLSPTMISSYFYISYRTLNRMFLKNLGMPPSKYIAMQKIEYAKQLLLTTDNSIERIAEILNFANPQHFRTVFVAHCGISPSKWKKENRQD